MISPNARLGNTLRRGWLVPLWMTRARSFENADDSKLRTSVRTNRALKLAGDWDNVGLLVEGPASRRVRRALLTIDFTETVLAEAIEKNVDFIVAYHPPIFGGLKRLNRSSPSTRLILETIEAGLTVWSPHTALDAMKGGVCDWLSAMVGEAKKSKPIEEAA